MKRFLPILLILASCAGNENRPKKENVQDVVPLDTSSAPATAFNVPQGFHPTKSLSDEAEFQFADTARGYYIVVELEPKEDVDLALSDEHVGSASDRLFRYVHIRQNALELEHRDYRPEKPMNVIYGGKTYVTFPFSDRVEGVKEPVQYRFSFIEGNGGIYTVTGWTIQSKSTDFEIAYREFLSAFVPD